MAGMTGRRVLVSGGSGFIGTYVCRRLVAQGDTPVVFDRHYGPVPRTDYETYVGDLRFGTLLTYAVESTDAVIHCADQLGTQETVEQPINAAETNILGSLRLWSALKRFQKPAVYITVGNHWMLNPYSITKTCAERFAWMYNQEHGTKIAVVRALNAYGPGQKLAPVRKILPTFISRALQGQPIEIYGDGQQIMDMIHVRDVADVLVRALDPPPDHYRSGIAYQAGTGRKTTVEEIADRVWAEVQGGRAAHTYLPMRPGEPEHAVVVADPTSLNPLYPLGFSPIGLEVGIQETVAFYRQQLEVQR